MVTITIITSLNLWVAEMDSRIVGDTIESVDYEMLILPVFPTQSDEIYNWADNLVMTSEVDKAYSNLAFFNVEDKCPFHAFRYDPTVTQPNLLLLSKESIPIIAKQFEVSGEFELNENEVLISEQQASKLEHIYNQTIIPGISVNLSVCRNNYENGHYVYQYEPSHYYNVTIKGIYNLKGKESTFQRTFQADYVKDSIIFLQESLKEGEIEEIEDNEIFPKIWVKINSEVLASDGYKEIIPKIDLFAEKLVIEFPFVAHFELTKPYLELKITYSRAERIQILVIPSILVGCIQSLLTVQMAVKQKEKNNNYLLDRGGLKKQIITLTILEYSTLAVIAIPLAILPCFYYPIRITKILLS